MKPSIWHKQTTIFFFFGGGEGGRHFHTPKSGVLSSSWPKITTFLFILQICPAFLNYALLTLCSLTIGWSWSSIGGWRKFHVESFCFLIVFWWQKKKIAWKSSLGSHFHLFIIELFGFAYLWPSIEKIIWYFHRYSWKHLTMSTKFWCLNRFCEGSCSSHWKVCDVPQKVWK